MENSSKFTSPHVMENHSKYTGRVPLSQGMACGNFILPGLFLSVFNHLKIKYKKFKDRYNFGHHECMRLLAGNENQDANKVFQSGGLKIKSYEKACVIADAIMSIAPYYEGFRRRSFVMAMITLLKNPEFDIKQFITKLKYQSTSLVDCTNSVKYIALIEKIYNFKSRNAVRLAA